MQEQLLSSGTILPYLAQNPQLLGAIQNNPSLFGQAYNAGVTTNAPQMPQQNFGFRSNPVETNFHPGQVGYQAPTQRPVATSQPQQPLSFNSDMLNAFAPQGFMQAGQAINGQMAPNTTIGGVNFQSRTPFQYTDVPMVNVANTYQPQYEMAKRDQEEQFQKTQEQMLSDLNSRGLLTTGATTKSNFDLMTARDRNLADLSSRFALEQGQAQTQEQQLRRQLDMQRQTNQAEELFRQSGATDDQARFLAQNMMAQQGQAFTQGLQGRQQATAEEQLANLFRRQPYEDLAKLYSGQIGQIGATPGNPGIMGALGSIAGSVLPMFCLPKGTKIKRLDQTETPVEDLRVGDEVLGGRVTATVSYLRAPSHQFSLHKFDNGKTIVMTKGHPAVEKIVSTEPVEHESRTTHDIRTTSGWYMAEDILLRSSIGMELNYAVPPGSIQ